MRPLRPHALAALAMVAACTDAPASKTSGGDGSPAGPEMKKARATRRERRAAQMLQRAAEKRARKAEKRLMDRAGQR